MPEKPLEPSKPLPQILIEPLEPYGASWSLIELLEPYGASRSPIEPAGALQGLHLCFLMLRRHIHDLGRIYASEGLQRPLIRFFQCVFDAFKGL